MASLQPSGRAPPSPRKLVFTSSPHTKRRSHGKEEKKDNQDKVTDKDIAVSPSSAGSSSLDGKAKQELSASSSTEVEITMDARRLVDSAEPDTPIFHIKDMPGLSNALARIQEDSPSPLNDNECYVEHTPLRETRQQRENKLINKKPEHKMKQKGERRTRDHRKGKEREGHTVNRRGREKKEEKKVTQLTPRNKIENDHSDDGTSDDFVSEDDSTSSSSISTSDVDEGQNVTTSSGLDSSRSHSGDNSAYDAGEEERKRPRRPRRGSDRKHKKKHKERSSSSSDDTSEASSTTSDSSSSEGEVIFNIPTHVKEEIVRINVGGYRYTTTKYVVGEKSKSNVIHQSLKFTGEL